MTTSLHVYIGLDKRAGVWVTEETTVPGLTAIDETSEGLLEQIRNAAPELLRLNKNSPRMPASPDLQYKILVTERRPEGNISVDSFAVSLSYAHMYQ